MKSLRSINPAVRAVGVIGGVAALVTGVTFAALQSQATLTRNTITSATANLQVKSTNNSFSSSDTGFPFVGMVPGGPAVPTVAFPFQLMNSGTGATAAKLHIVAKVPTLPTFTVTDQVDPVNPAKVHVLLSCVGLTPTVVDTTLDVLHTTGVDLGASTTTLDPGVTTGCSTQVKMESDAFTGSSASSDNFDIQFTGMAAI